MTNHTHGSPELDADAAKLLAMGADPGPTIDELFGEPEAPTSEPRYTTSDDTEFLISIGETPCFWVGIQDHGKLIASCYMGTWAENKARAKLIVDLLNAHDAAAINAVLARHRDLAGANGRPEGGA